MKHARGALVIAAGVLFSACHAQAQISHVTVRTPKSPAPPMVLVQSNTVPATAAQAVPVIAPRAAIVYRPRHDKNAVERRVVAFQKKRAEEGSASAQFQLGLRYLTGDGVPMNKGEARKWLSLASKNGDTGAKRKLAELGSELAPGQVSGSAKPPR